MRLLLTQATVAWRRRRAGADGGARAPLGRAAAHAAELRCAVLAAAAGAAPVLHHGQPRCASGFGGSLIAGETGGCARHGSVLAADAFGRR